MKPIGTDTQKEVSVNTENIFAEPTDKIMFPTPQTKDITEAPVKKERGRQKYENKAQLKAKKKRTQSLNPFTRKQDQEKLSNYENQNIDPSIDAESYTQLQTGPKTDGCKIM